MLAAISGILVLGSDNMLGVHAIWIALNLSQLRILGTSSLYLSSLNLFYSCL